jgi:hypothetical protein
MVNHGLQRHIDKITAQVGPSHDPLIEIPDDLGHDWDTTVFIEQSLRHVLHSKIARQETQLPYSGFLILREKLPEYCP